MIDYFWSIIFLLISYVVPGLFITNWESLRLFLGVSSIALLNLNFEYKGIVVYS